MLTNGTPSATPAPPTVKSPGSAKALQLSPAHKLQAIHPPNGANGSSAAPAASPTSPALEVVRSIASPAPSSGKPEKQKRLSNAEKKKVVRDRAASEAEASKDGSKPASPAPGGAAALVAGPSAKHGKKGSKASGGFASPSSAPSPVPTPGPDGNKHGAATPTDGMKSPPPQSRTPGLGGGRRHPWTLYLSRLPVPVTEQEVKDCFEDAKTSVCLTESCSLASVADNTACRLHS